MNASDWPGRTFWQWTAFAAAIVMMWFAWPFAGVQYYGLGLLAVGCALLVGGVLLRPTARAWVLAVAVVAIGILPLGMYFALAAT